MSIPAFHGQVSDDGQLLLDARGLFRTWLGKLKGKRVTVAVIERKPAKSQAQLGYLKGELIPFIAEHICDYAPHECHDKAVIQSVHDGLKHRLGYLKPEPNPLKEVESAATWDTARMSSYIDGVRDFALLEYGLVTPEPEKDATKRKRTKEAA